MVRDEHPAFVRLRLDVILAGLTLRFERVEALLKPFLAETELDDRQIEQVLTFFNLLQKWSLKTNLTGIRAPQHGADQEIRRAGRGFVHNPD